MKLSTFPKYLQIAVFLYNESWIPTELNRYQLEASIANGFIIELLSKFLQFSYNLHKTTDMGWKLPNGSYNGCIGMVERETHISVCPIAPREDIFSIVHFSYPYIYTPVTFVTDQPQPLPNKFAIFYALSWQIWLTMCISILLVSIFFYIFFRKKLNYPYILLQMFGSLFEQSFNIKCSAVSFKISMLSWILGIMCITYSYKAILLATISFPNFSGVRDIKDLSKSSQNPLFACFTYKENGNLKEIMMTSEDESLKNIGKCINRTPQPQDEDQFTRNSSFKKAYINVQHYLTHFAKDMFVSDDAFYYTMGSVTVNKRFCCLDALNDAILRIFETGFIGKYLHEREFFQNLKTEAFFPDLSSNRVLRLDDLYGAFIILIVGLVFSIFMFLLEVMFCKKELKSRKHQKILFRRKRV